MAFRGHGSGRGTQGGRRASCHAHPYPSNPPRGTMHNVSVCINMAPITMRRWRGWKSCAFVCYLQGVESSADSQQGGMNKHSGAQIKT